MKTKCVMDLALKTLSLLVFTSDSDKSSIIDQVFVKIEKTPRLMSLYNSAVKQLGNDVVNQWIAKYTLANVTDKVIGKVRTKSTSKLIHDYTHLIFSTHKKSKLKKK